MAQARLEVEHEGYRLAAVDNRLPRQHVLINGAWFSHDEDKLGSIEVGKLGDVVVLSDDFLDPARVPDEAIKRLTSVLTIVGGCIVYASGALPVGVTVTR